MSAKVVDDRKPYKVVRAMGAGPAGARVPWLVINAHGTHVRRFAVEDDAQAEANRRNSTGAPAPVAKMERLRAEVML